MINHFRILKLPYMFGQIVSFVRIKLIIYMTLMDWLKNKGNNKHHYVWPYEILIQPIHSHHVCWLHHCFSF